MKYTILVADDEKEIRELLRLYLENSGYNVAEAEDGQQALECFKGSEEGFFDAILMDVRMPVMDGMTATKMIRELPRIDAKTIPIIAMTANAFDEDKEHTKEAGMNAHLAKPIEPRMLYDTLAQQFLLGRQ